MQYVKGLRCSACGHLNEIQLIYKCERCSGSLDVEYDYDNLFKDKPFKVGQQEGIWSYRSLLPVGDNVKEVTLGEGNTPLLYSPILSKESTGEQVYMKTESINPTLSFKDRPLSVALTVSREFHVEKVVTASTGNTGVAAAAYAARAKIPCKIFVPASTPKEKLAMMELYGAEIELVEGNFSDAYNAAGKAAVENDWLNLTSTFLNPYAIEGDKTLAYEIYDQYGGVPDWILISIGAGPLLVSCYKGFKELQKAGEIDSLPKMVGVQAEGCAPIVKAFDEGKEKVEPWRGKTDTIASGIADPLTSYPEDGTRTLNVIRESQGLAIAVSDNKTSEFQRLLAKEEGVFVEPASATVAAALEVMRDKGWIENGQSLVCVLTGHGLKDLESIK